jgi:hypothetical protein
VFTIFASNTNEIEGTFGRLPALNLARGKNYLKRQAENAHDNGGTHVRPQPQGPARGGRAYLLRLPDAESKTREYARFVDDFRIAAVASRKAARAA